MKTMNKVINKDPNKAYINISNSLSNFSNEFIVKIGETLSIEERILIKIKGLYGKLITFEELEREESILIVKALRRILQKIFRLQGNKKRKSSNKRSLYGGGNVFDGNGKNKIPVNKLAAKGIKRI